MTESKRQSIVVNNPWQLLRKFTPGRIALGRTGVSLPTQQQLAFQLDHARARDAVHHDLNGDGLAACVNDLRLFEPCVVVESAAESRAMYLQRPDLGRRLSARSKLLLQSRAEGYRGANYDLAFVIADGLSALAIESSAVALLQAMHKHLIKHPLRCAPLVIVRQGRVAIGDEIGELMAAKVVVVLIGERPGLSSPDSMGLYMTWAPRVGLTDERRNCISNIRPAGLPYEEAADKLYYLVSEALSRRLSGVQLKDETSGSTIQGRFANFLLGD
ncbi:MAG: ethanolamine ammonia-lyase subunit EutC [Burkholderiales bacterium]